MAYVRPAQGLAITGVTDSGHWVVMDTKKEAGGVLGGPSPMELVLQAVMGCTMMDVVSILEKMKVRYDLFEVSETHERAADHPKVYTKLHLIYRFEGKDIDVDKVRKAVDLSLTKYCSVHAMLSKAVDITHHMELNGKKLDG
ncbi:MAG: OsmC family protein [Candidatus Thermoplasmatota archaeon]|nr:OsmC family protein [Candidatus Thermoplasmatota archaeon]